jgi:hypothetical protein
MATFQMSSWNLLAPQRRSANAEKAPQRAELSVGKQSERDFLPYLIRYSKFSLCSLGMDSTSDADGPESEEDDVEAKNPYPLDGKYIDEYDRQRYTATFLHRLPSLTHDLIAS